MMNCIAFLLLAATAACLVDGRETCKNFYEDYSCKMIKVRSLCGTFKKYCELTCGVCKRPTPLPTTEETTTEPDREWSECTKTCGAGTRYYFVSSRCTNSHNPRCERRFQECNTSPCPREYCRSNQSPRYGFMKGCCNQRPLSSNPLSRNGARKYIKDEWPWMVLVTAFGDVCGGALIHKQWVVTAARCVSTGKKRIKTQGINVYVGIDNFDDAKSRKRYRVRKAIVFPKYEDAHGDIALIQLSKPVRSNFAEIISLPRSEITPIDSTCMVVGWGLSAGRSKRSLEDVNQQVLDFGICRNYYGDDRVLEQPVSKRVPRLLCAGNLSEENKICNNDVGNVLACQRCTSCDWYVAGITTATKHGACGQTGYPTLFTQVRSYEEWICRHIPELQTRLLTCPYKYGP